LKAARERARRAREQLLDGIDPLEARRAQRAAAANVMTFKQAAAAYYEQHEGRWKNAKHRAQFLSTLESYAHPLIGSRPVSSIDTPAVLRVLEQPVVAERGYPAGQFWASRPETANRVRGRIETVLDWATVRGHRSGDNPARWKSHLDQVLPGRGQIAKVEHHPALPYSQLPAVVAALAIRPGTAARALQFLILTASRTGDVIGARWSEVDLANRVWTIPAGRMKAGREHRVPLSDTAVLLLRSLLTEDNNEFVFIGPRAGAGLSDMSMTAVLRRMGHTEITVHGFRSTFRDWAAEVSHFPNHVVEMALAHAIGDKVEAAYRRGDLFDKRRELMAAWADYCETKH
jgi:integrase